MSLEQAILALTAAVEANTAAILGGAKADPVAADKPTKAEKPVKQEKPKQKTGEEVTAVMNQVKDKFGAPAARAIINGLGFSALKELVADGSKNDEAFKQATEKLEAEEAGDDM